MKLLLSGLYKTPERSYSCMQQGPTFRLIPFQHQPASQNVIFRFTHKVKKTKGGFPPSPLPKKM